MAGPFDLTGQNIENTYQRLLQIDGALIYDGTGSLVNITPSGSSPIDTSSFATTGSNTFIGNQIITGSLNVSEGVTAASFTGSLLGTASYATNALSSSYAANGGVTQLLAGPNVTLSPTNGLGQVTVSATLSGSTIFNTATGSYGSFYDTTTQTNPVTNVPRSMSFDSTDISNGVSISGSTSPFNTYVKTQNAGIYNIQFSAQVDKTDGGTDDIVIWLRKNGIDLTDTATTLTLPTNNSKVVAAWNWFVTSAAGDYYQIIWRSLDTNMRLLAEPISGTHPGIPSVILTVNRVDQFLSNTGSFSGSFTGTLEGTSSYATQALSASYAPSTPAFPFTGSAEITGSLTVTGSIYTNSTIYSPFIISINFETITSYTYKAPYALKIDSVESNPSSSITLSYVPSGSVSSSNYVFGATINKFDSLTVIPLTSSLVILNSVRI